MITTKDVLSLTAALVAVAIVVFYNKIKPFDTGGLPGPESHFLLGSLQFFDENYPHNWPTVMVERSLQYGQSWIMPLPRISYTTPGAFVFVHDEGNIRHVLQNNFNNYIKGDPWIIFTELLGQGIFVVDDEKWKYHRKLMSTMFSRNLLKSSAKTVGEKFLEVIDVFEKKIAKANEGKDGGDDNMNKGVDIDLQDMFFRVTFDSTFETACGMHFDSIQGKCQHDFPIAFDELSLLSNNRFSDPLVHVKKKFQLTRDERRIRQLAHYYLFETLEIKV
eukprot:CAMPEP_0197252568 /NCGR_PEP_ID=MMETSP1429-20130617/61963_1 /TAXON_ID=49237 /ORGANISM="Chaetoceros  sp., Strain UNC1202" /LENGTH=275 /DNA_ID=CAMNT_0042714987 /DNA_START=91 /DNA_END=918 /DNA_ORIENTATION=-